MTHRPTGQCVNQFRQEISGLRLNLTADMQTGKERSPRHHLRISSDEQDGALLLANPMTCSDAVSPVAASSAQQQFGAAGGQLARTSERASFKKSRPKSPSLLRFFVRGNKKPSVDADEEEMASSGSDHEDPFSPKSTMERVRSDYRHSTDSSQGRIDMTTGDRRKQRPSHRDSGFGSERDSVSRTEEHDGHLPNIDNTSPLFSPLEDNRPRGMEALEMLHNQLQILVKSECPQTGEEEEVDIQSQVILSLQQQLEDMQQSADCLRQSDESLRLSLRIAEQRAQEAEAKLAHSLNRCARVEQTCTQLLTRYHSLCRKHKDLEAIQQRQAILQQMERVNRTRQDGSPNIPQRVNSQREFDRKKLLEEGNHRPSSSQGFNPTPPAYHSSHSVTETCV